MGSSLTRNNNLRNTRMHLRTLISACAISAACCLAVGKTGAAPAPDSSRPLEGDFVIHDFHFDSGETLPEMRMHYTYFGRPHKDAQGRVTNAVLILHGTGGSGRSLVNDRFSGVLFQHGQLLDAGKYFIVLPDSIGHGKSSKPSDGLRVHFPQYDYQDMVAAEYALVKGLGAGHLRLGRGTSM